MSKSNRPEQRVPDAHIPPAHKGTVSPGWALREAQVRPPRGSIAPPPPRPHQPPGSSALRAREIAKKRANNPIMWWLSRHLPRPLAALIVALILTLGLVALMVLMAVIFVLSVAYPLLGVLFLILIVAGLISGAVDSELKWME